MSFVWDKNWEIGISSIDAQHRELMDIINKLGDAMRERKAAEVVSPVLKELSNYTKKHFTFEEALMRRYGYEELESHKPYHKKFIDKLAEFQEKIDTGNIAIGVQMYNFLGDWLRGHIRGIDTKYAEVLKDKGAK
ncbi:MAG: bacteriohemerythrin [Deltaproteobacteria bacterium]|nr:bacteriohemerythrin [Deltaproteobacteria bacterium]MBN2671886.1 bacteriohemerythrin [Deltaproteobacteria bacterium]